MNEPGPIVKTSIAVLSGGDIAEGVVDSSNQVWARWYNGTGWSPWQLVGAGLDVSVTALTDSTAYLSVAFGGYPGQHPAEPTRGVWEVSASAVTPVSL